MAATWSSPETRGNPSRRRSAGHIKRALAQAPRDLALAVGMPPSLNGYRWVRHENLPDYVARRSERAVAKTVHEERVIEGALPLNISDARQLTDEASWFGFSFRDVLARTAAPTTLAVLDDCRVCYARAGDRNVFYPAILTPDDTAIEMREVRFRPFHAPNARKTARRIDRVTWIYERAYHNHAHWLTAHLPKLLLLKQRGALGDLILPQNLSPTMRASLELLQLEPSQFGSFDEQTPLSAGALTLISCDRFRPELLRPVRETLAPISRAPWRRVFIGRASQAGRQLLCENELWPKLRGLGFERVLMEDLDFRQQIELMSETAVLLAPHGAGLANMMFCPPGAHIIEIANRDYPNPNFYALACAMQHKYWIVTGDSRGDQHPLWRDLAVTADTILETVRQVERAA